MKLYTSLWFEFLGHEVHAPCPLPIKDKDIVTRYRDAYFKKGMLVLESLQTTGLYSLLKLLLTE